MSRLDFLSRYAVEGRHYDQEAELLNHVNNPKIVNRLYHVFNNKNFNITKPVMDAIVDKAIDPKRMNPHASVGLVLHHRFYDFLKPEHINKMLDVNEPDIIPIQAAFHANTSENLTKAMQHPSRKVRHNAVMNPDVTIGHLEAAYDDPSNDERLKRDIASVLYNKRKENGVI